MPIIYARATNVMSVDSENETVKKVEITVFTLHLKRRIGQPTFENRYDKYTSSMIVIKMSINLIYKSLF